MLWVLAPSGVALVFQHYPSFHPLIARRNVSWCRKRGTGGRINVTRDNGVLRSFCIPIPRPAPFLDCLAYHARLGCLQYAYDFGRWYLADVFLDNLAYYLAELSQVIIDRPKG